MAWSDLFDTLRLDVRLAVRLLWKHRGFTAVAIATMALSTGATTATFAIVEATLIRALPYAESDRLVAITANRTDGTLKGLNVSHTKLQRIEEQSHTLSAVGGFFAVATSFSSGDVPEDVPGAIASPGLFDVLAISPAIGRGFMPDENRAGGAGVAVITDGFWKSHFGADRSVVGRSLRFDGKSVTVVGILPPSFRFPFQLPEPQVWFPRVFENPVFGLDRVLSGASFLTVFGRMQSTTSIAEVRQELGGLNAAYAHDVPGAADATLILEAESAKNALVGPVRVSLLTLLAAVSFVLLIGCTNIASLQMARATTRESEIALRRALGASRAQLVRQLLNENLLLSLSGGAIGLVLAAAIVDAVPRLPAGLLPRITEVHLDSGVLGFALAISLLSGLVFGLVPSLRASGVALQGVLKQGAHGAVGGRSASRVRGALVVAQVSWCLSCAQVSWSRVWAS